MTRTRPKEPDIRDGWWPRDKTRQHQTQRRQLMRKLSFPIYSTTFVRIHETVHYIMKIWQHCFTHTTTNFGPHNKKNVSCAEILLHLKSVARYLCWGRSNRETVIQSTEGLQIAMWLCMGRKSSLKTQETVSDRQCFYPILVPGLESVNQSFIGAVSRILFLIPFNIQYWPFCLNAMFLWISAKCALKINNLYSWYQKNDQRD